MKHRRLIFPGMILAAAVAAASAAPVPDTFVREFAKNRVAVIIVVSGPQAADVGQRLQSQILQAPDNKHAPSHIPVFTIEEAERLAEKDPQFPNASLVFLISGEDRREALPPALNGLVPVRPGGLKENESAITAEISRPVNKGLAFRVLMAAPDGGRLNRLYRLFDERTAPSFRDLPLDEHHLTNNLALFSAPEDRAIVEHWGSEEGVNDWSTVRWYPLEERRNLEPAALKDTSEVYFLDRSRPNLMIPSTVAAIAPVAHLAANDTLVQRGALQDGRKFAVFSAPSDLILLHKLMHYKNIDTLPVSPAIERVSDFRAIGRASLVVRGIHLNPDEAEQIRFKLAEYMRRSMNVPITEPDPRLAPAENTDEGLQQNGSRYVWLLQFTQFGGSTEFEAAERKLTPDPGEFDEEEPPRPERAQDESRRDYEDRLDDWRRAHDEWERHRDRFEADRRHAPCQWERTIYARHSAEVEGELRLVDTQNPGQPLWVETLGLKAQEKTPFRSDLVTISGHDNRPSSLEPPANLDTCPPSLLEDTAYRAGVGGLDTLAEKAWLPQASDAAQAVLR